MPVEWISGWEGVFKLADSDAWCGSKVSVEDAAEVLRVTPAALDGLPVREEGGTRYLCELDLHKAWSGGTIVSPEMPRMGRATRSLDEVILMAVVRRALPGAVVTPQVRRSGGF